MDLSKVFSRFCEQLSQREGFLSEDNVRFYWFRAMLAEDSELNHFSLEEPYPENGNIVGHKELDLMYEDKDEVLAIEIKFHRHTSQRAFPHTMAAGELFDDIQRLPLWENKKDNKKNVRYFFLYVTDEEMHKYLSGSAKTKLNAQFRQTLRGFYIGKNGTIPTCNFTSKDAKGDTPTTFFKTACSSSNKDEKSRLQFCNIHLLEQNEMPCKSESLKTPKFWARLYEIQTEK